MVDENYKRIYIRHGDKAYGNGKVEKYKHDPPLTIIGVKEMTTLTLSLLEKYRLPQYIISSPYRRCRESAGHIIKTIYLNTGKEIPLFIDVNVSEYLGNHKKSRLDVYPETMKYNPPHPETFHNFRQRIIDHDSKCPDNVWVVTHGIVIDTVARIRNKARPKLSTGQSWMYG